MLRSRAWLPLLAVLCGSQLGCSFAFTDTLPDGHAGMRYFDCTSTPGLAVADGVFALSSALSAAVVLSDSKQEFEEKNDGASQELAAGVNIVAATVFAVSGVYGILHSEKCRGEKRTLRARYGTVEEGAEGTLQPVERTRRPLPAKQETPPPAAPPSSTPPPPAPAPSSGAQPDAAPPNAAPPSGSPPPATPSEAPPAAAPSGSSPSAAPGSPPAAPPPAPAPPASPPSAAPSPASPPPGASPRAPGTSAPGAAGTAAPAR